MNVLATAHDASVQMIDTSIVRVHQHGACIIRNRRQSLGRSRGGLTSKIHALVDTNGLPVRLALTAGEAHDNRLADKLLSRLKSGSMLLADRGYDADWIRALAVRKGALANIPPRCNRSEPICFGSSTRSSIVAESQRATTNWRPTTSLSSSLRQSDYGCALMSPRPSNGDESSAPKRKHPPCGGRCRGVPGRLDALGTFPGRAGDIAATEADIGQFPIAEPVQLAKALVVPTPLPEHTDQIRQEHSR
jgi:transposase